MENSKVKVFSNWAHVGGCTFSQFVQQRVADPDFFIKPHLNELVDELKSILLSKEQTSEYCELNVKIFPHYKIQAASFVCNAVKVEIFQGHMKEYLQTIYGVVAEEPEDQFKSYRYDVEIEKSGIMDLTLRFLTDSSDVCIFGLMLHTLPNPNGITTLSSFNGYVQAPNILQNSTEQPVADKCAKLLELIKTSKRYNSLSSDHMKESINKGNDDCTAATGKTNEDMFEILKSYIDECLKEIEMRINKCLEAVEQRQNHKLDRILYILEKSNLNKS